jgi:hypothetical protein
VDPARGIFISCAPPFFISAALREIPPILPSLTACLSCRMDIISLVNSSDTTPLFNSFDRDIIHLRINDALS